MGILVESLVKVPMTAIIKGVTEMEDLGEGMTVMMGMIMMVHPSLRHHQRPPEVNKKKDKKKAPGDGGGGGDDDPDKDSDDSDEKFVRRMKKFLGGGFNQSGNDEKPKVKEADTIKLPAISRVRRHIETGVSKPERP